MILASDINDSIFSYLLAQELCSCFATCKLWHASMRSRSTSVPIWFNLYRHLVDAPKLSPHCDDFSWREKVGSTQPVRLVCRSGHSASLFYVETPAGAPEGGAGGGWKEVVVFFGGATHFYTFVNTYDILSVEDGVPMRTYAIVEGDVPTARWLHRACSFENNTRAIIFGGQVNDGAFSNDVYLFNVASTSTQSQSGVTSSTLSLECVLVPPVDGDNRSGPQPRGGHSFVYQETRNRFLIFGGLTSGNEIEICVNDTYELTLQDEVFFTLSEAISPGRLGYDCEKKPATTRTQPHNFGVNRPKGSRSKSGPMAVWRKLQCTGKLPSPRWCHSSVLQGDSMMVFGGWSYERAVGVSTGSDFLNDLYVLDVRTLVWTEVQTSGISPRPRCQCACFLFNKNSENSEKCGRYESNYLQDINNYHSRNKTLFSSVKTVNNSDKISNRSEEILSSCKKAVNFDKYSVAHLAEENGDEGRNHRDIELQFSNLDVGVTAGTSSSPSSSSSSPRRSSLSGDCSDNTTNTSSGPRDNKARTRDNMGTRNRDMDRTRDMDIRLDRDRGEDRDGVGLTGKSEESGQYSTESKHVNNKENSNSAVNRADDYREGRGNSDFIGKKFDLSGSWSESIRRQTEGSEGGDVWRTVPERYIDGHKHIKGSSIVNRSEDVEDEGGGLSVSAVCGEAIVHLHLAVPSSSERTVHALTDTDNRLPSSEVTYLTPREMDSGHRHTDSLTARGLLDTPVTKGYLIIFGGSSHNQEVSNTYSQYSSLVVDFHDFKILDLDTMVWLPVACSYPKCRGGIHAVVETSRGWLLSGGMQTEGISDMPRFKNDTTYIVPNIGLTRRPSSSSSSSNKSQSKSVKLTDISNIEDLRLKKKFMTVKA